MASKKIKTIIKVNLPAGAATPAPPLGPVLGQHGVAIMEFVKAYNERTSDMKGEIVPAVVTIYEDRSFDFELRKAPVADMIKKKLNLQKGSSNPLQQKIATLTDAQLTEIAQAKMPDLNTKDLSAAIRIVEGTARSMGVEITE